MADLTGKTAIITGGTQGLGEATARLFADRGAAGIVICGRNRDKGEAVAKSIEACPVLFHQADLANVDDMFALSDRADSAFGRIDCLVNAGASTARGTILDTTPDTFDGIMNTNLRGPFFLMQAVLKVMVRESIEGSIVNIASMSARAGQSFLSPYVASKGALTSLTRNVAWTVMRNRIRVNALNIGWMESDQERALHAAQGHGEDWFAERRAEQPFGRLVDPAEVARAIAFLCSDESGLLTGEVINFDQTIWGANEAPPPAPARASLP